MPSRHPGPPKLRFVGLVFEPQKTCLKHQSSGGMTGCLEMVCLKTHRFCCINSLDVNTIYHWNSQTKISFLGGGNFLFDRVWDLDTSGFPKCSMGLMYLIYLPIYTIHLPSRLSKYVDKQTTRPHWVSGNASFMLGFFGVENQQKSHLGRRGA